MTLPKHTPAMSGLFLCMMAMAAQGAAMETDLTAKLGDEMLMLHLESELQRTAKDSPLLEGQALVQSSDDSGPAEKLEAGCTRTSTTKTRTTTTQTTATITTTLRVVQLMVEKPGVMGFPADRQCIQFTPYLAEESFTLDFMVDILNSINYNSQPNQPLDVPLVAKWQSHPHLVNPNTGFEVRLVTEGASSPFIKLRVAFGGIEKTAHAFVDLTGTDGWARVTITYSRVAQQANIFINGKVTPAVNSPPPFNEGSIIQHIGKYPDTYIPATLTDFCIGTDNEHKVAFNSDMKDIRFYKGVADLGLLGGGSAGGNGGGGGGGAGGNGGGAGGTPAPETLVDDSRIASSSA